RSLSRFLCIDTHATGVYSRSLHDALPISLRHYSSQTEPGPLAGMCRASAREMVKQLGFAPKHQILTGLAVAPDGSIWARRRDGTDRKSTRLNSSHVKISYAVFCLKKKKD